MTQGSKLVETSYLVAAYLGLTLGIKPHGLSFDDSGGLKGS
jgi:hypothetical protein